jgi:large subunit ribosomal protein L15
MKLHDLKPAPGSRRAKTRVGRGIAAGQGKTAGRGTKGQKARAGGTIPAWFEGGQTPIHVRVPKLRGFNNDRFRIEYQVVNVGQISAYAEAGRFGVELEQDKPAGRAKSGDAPVTVNAEVLAQAGLIRGDKKPLKILGQGEVGQKLFVAADAFSASARQKIEDAGGFVQLLREPEAAQETPADESAAPAEPKRSRKASATEQAQAVAAPVEDDQATDVAPLTGESAAIQQAAPTEEAAPTQEAAPADEPVAVTEAPAVADEPAPAETERAEASVEPAESAASPESESAKPARRRTAKKDVEGS